MPYEYCPKCSDIRWRPETEWPFSLDDKWPGAFNKCEHEAHALIDIRPPAQDWLSKGWIPGSLL